MTREEIKQLVKTTFAWELVGESGSVIEGEEELVDAMVAAYNRAIDDAVELLNNSPEYDIHAALKLKIK